LNAVVNALMNLVDESCGQNCFEAVEIAKSGDKQSIAQWFRGTTEWIGWPRKQEDKHARPADYQLVDVALPLACTQYADKHKMLESIALYNAESTPAIIVFTRKDRKPEETEFVYRSWVEIEGQGSAKRVKIE